MRGFILCNTNPYEWISTGKCVSIYLYKKTSLGWAGPSSASIEIKVDTEWFLIVVNALEKFPFKDEIL